MIEFINYGSSALTFVVFLIALYLNRGSKEKSYLLSIVTGLMFLYTLLVMPVLQKSKADDNIAAYEKGIRLSCVSGFLMYGSTFKVDKSKWDLEGNYFINKQAYSIRADKCEEL